MSTTGSAQRDLTRPFPPGFVWGTATASYQIEGAVEADGRGPSIWDTFSHTPGAVRNGDTGDIACDHYHRVDEDLDLLADLGVSAYRFSVAWPRVQPLGSGSVNQAGLDFYRRILDGLLERDIAPTVTLYHWDLPQPLEDRGGWTIRDTAERYAEYVEIVANALGGDVDRWITLNEPWCSSWLGYGSGRHAPGISDIGKAAAATHHLLYAHGLAVPILRSITPAAKVGITLNLGDFQPGSQHELDIAAARRADGNLNRIFLDPLFRGQYPEDMLEHYHNVTPGFRVVRDGDLGLISAPLDFLGVNYYFPSTVVDETRTKEARVAGYFVAQDDQFPDLRLRGIDTPGREKTAMDWEIEASGLTSLLIRVREEYTTLPIFITENGAAFDDYVDPNGQVKDYDRVAYLQEHISAVHDAIDAGVNVQGYFVWSLLDNFEWALGYSRRFGIVWVDYPSGTRLTKQSFSWYRDTIESNSVEYATSAGAM
ncbi:MAG TPA: GH1 family beta-glucosidase [Acidimicrobiales bacterium]|nr:GH1 family beta-glucosidase [Acidimicrobiales bacterium]